MELYCSVLGFISVLVARFHLSLSLFLSYLSFYYLSICLLFLSLSFFSSVPSAAPLWICMPMWCTARSEDKTRKYQHVHQAECTRRVQQPGAWSVCFCESLHSKLPVSLSKQQTNSSSMSIMSATDRSNSLPVLYCSLYISAFFTSV